MLIVKHLKFWNLSASINGWVARKLTWAQFFWNVNNSPIAENLYRITCAKYSDIHCSYCYLTNYAGKLTWEVLKRTLKKFNSFVYFPRKTLITCPLKYEASSFQRCRTTFEIILQRDLSDLQFFFLNEIL